MEKPSTAQPRSEADNISPTIITTTSYNTANENDGEYATTEEAAITRPGVAVENTLSYLEQTNQLTRANSPPASNQDNHPSQNENCIAPLPDTKSKSAAAMEKYNPTNLSVPTVSSGVLSEETITSSIQCKQSKKKAGSSSQDNTTTHDATVNQQSMVNGTTPNQPSSSRSLSIIQQQSHLQNHAIGNNSSSSNVLRFSSRSKKDSIPKNPQGADPNFVPSRLSALVALLMSEMEGKQIGVTNPMVQEKLRDVRELAKIVYASLVVDLTQELKIPLLRAVKTNWVNFNQ